ncbi:Holo-[acyl-carrier-protein] synthase [Gammaproteobacteria bacterium MOLA455]|nr:Holo-[acyl-carrier-protein] synthase [Gammaproteobacteria bacterium MOLA455]
MIIAIGTDIVEIARIAKVLERQAGRFLERILCPSELQQYASRGNPVAFVATRFAAKEAIAKALGTGIGHGVSFQDMQISNDDRGAPHVQLSGGAAQVLHSLGGQRVLLSLADERDYAIAYAMLSE